MVTPTNPGWATGYVPTATEWAAAFSAKADFPTPIDQGGTGAQSSFSANYNIAQRVTVNTNGYNAQALTFYGMKSSVGALSIDLPPLSSLGNGDWIQIIDIDNDAGTNNITIAANGADQINFNGVVAGTQALTANGLFAMLMVNNGVWTMIVFATSGTVVPPGPVTTSGLTQNTDRLLGRTTAGVGPIEEIVVGGSLTFASGQLDGSVKRLLPFNILGTALTASEQITAFTPPIGETWTFPANLIGSSGLKMSTGVNPASTYTLDIDLNGSVIANVIISTLGVVTFTTVGGAPFNVVGGTDYISIVGPAIVDVAVNYAFMLLASYA